MARRLASTLGLIYEDLQNTATKVEFKELRSTVEEPTEAQKRTRQRVDWGCVWRKWPKPRGGPTSGWTPSGCAWKNWGR